MYEKNYEDYMDNLRFNYVWKFPKVITFEFIKLQKILRF